MTHCQEECRSLSGGVPENLTLHWMKKIFFSFYHQKEEIRSFPTMYNTWGSSLGRYGSNKSFIQKSTLKLGFFLDTVLDHLTSEVAGTQNFKGIAIFNMCFEKYRTSASKWAMGKASNFNIVRLAATWICFRCRHEKMLKTDVLHKTLIPRNLLKGKNIQDRTMWKLTSWAFRKSIFYGAGEI